MTIYIILAVAAIIILWVIATYNKLVSSRMKVKEGYSTIDVFLKKRYDLVPNLVETVKGYASHEKETLEKVVSARGKAISSSPQDKMKNEAELSGALGRIFALAESYPELKSDSHFINLQNQLQTLESEIEKSRRYYNGVVRSFNTSIQVMPSCIVASIFHFKEEPFFEVTDSSQRENVEVKF